MVVRGAQQLGEDKGGGMNQLDLLLVNPGGRQQTYQNLASELSAIEPPVWAGLMATFVRKRGYSVEILDANAEALSPEEVARTVDVRNPRLVGIVVYGQNPNASTQTMPAASATCTAIKQSQPERKVIMLGGHVAALPERTLQEEACDYVSDGEGLWTLVDLLEGRAVSECRGLGYWAASQDFGGDEVVITQSPPLVTDLDGELSTVAWDLLPMGKYRCHNWQSWCNKDGKRSPYAAIYTSLGCPFKCLRGDTKINTINGKVPIKSLVKFGSYPVYVYDPKTRNVFIERVRAIRKYGENERLVRVNFTDGTHIDCTPDHEFVQFKWGNGRGNSKGSVEWGTQAQNLKPGNHIRAVREEPNKTGRVFVSWARRSGKYRARMVMEFLEGRELSSEEFIHHKDHDQGNDKPGNLELLADRTEHMARHPEIAERMREDNPAKNMTPEWRAKLRAAVTGKVRTLESRQRYRESKLGKKNPNYKHGETCGRGPSRVERNHVVESVEWLEETDDVYCLTTSTGWFFANDVAVKNCHFCCIQAPFKSGEAALNGWKPGQLKLEKVTANSYRLWNPETVVDQVCKLWVNYGIRNIKFADEMFVLNKSHVEGICDRLIAAGIADDLNIWAYARVDTCNDEALLAKMRQAGFRWLALGIESAVESVRSGVAKGYKQSFIAQAVNRVKEAGIHVGANYIFGLPDDDHDSMHATFDLACELNTPYANFYCFPAGTPVWTPDGFKNIETMRLGDEVYGKTGVTRVTKVGTRLADDLVEIKPRYLPPFRCTSEHPMCVAVISRDKHSNKATFRRMEWVDAGNLKTFDKEDKYAEYHALTINRKSFRREQTYIDFSPFVIGSVGVGSKGGQLNKIGQKYMTPWPVTEELAELFGWYVAEGSLTSRKNKQIGFSLHANETEHHTRIQYLIQRCLGLKSRVRAVGPNCVSITFTSKVWLRGAHSLFGKDARTKRIPDFIMNASDEVGRAFLTGYLNGDGTSYPNSLGQHGVGTASPVLGQQLIMLFLKLGVVPSCATEAAKVGKMYGNDIHTGPQYRLAWMDEVHNRKPHSRFLKTDDWFFIPVKTMEQVYGEERVFNLTTEDQTFSMPWVTHNCAQAYPGSKLYTDTLAINSRDLPKDWLGYSQFGHDCQPLPTKHLSAAEVLRFREYAWQTYYQRPAYLQMMAETFGKQALEEVRKTGQTKMRYRLLEAPKEKQDESQAVSPIDPGCDAVGVCSRPLHDS